jgi:hypothetical protein
LLDSQDWLGDEKGVDRILAFLPATCQGLQLWIIISEIGCEGVITVLKRKLMNLSAATFQIKLFFCPCEPN